MIRKLVSLFLVVALCIPVMATTQTCKSTNVFASIEKQQPKITTSSAITARAQHLAQLTHPAKQQHQQVAFCYVTVIFGVQYLIGNDCSKYSGGGLGGGGGGAF
jgi:hypothetical protein